MKNNKKKIISTFCFVVVVFIINILFINSVFAVTKDDIKNSLQKMFAKTITLEETAENGEVISTTTLNKGTKFEVNDSQIKVTYTYNGKEENFLIDYKFEENKCKFNTKYESTNKIEDEILKVFKSNIYVAYWAVSDTTKINLSLAYNYFRQETNNLADNSSNEIFIYTNEITDNSASFNLEVNLGELEKLEATKLKESANVKITFYEENSNKVNVELKNESNGSVANQGASGTANSVQNQPYQNTINQTDKTVANMTTVPKAGIQVETKDILKVIIVISAIGIVFVALYNKKSK
ncbi:MAG: hypothetical protein HFJ45_03800 [Clostridia bacterium]|nr:hypothetical protein [Clostridia bacterium]